MNEQATQHPQPTPVASHESASEPRFPDAPVGRLASEPFLLSASAPGQSPRPAASPRRRAPGVVTGAVLAAALVVVGTSTWAAQQPEPAPVAAPSVAPVRLTRSSVAPGTAPGSTAAPSAPIQIEVGTADARATLAVPQHRWTTAGRSNRTRLMVRVQLTVRSGTLSYDPNLVKLFDEQGRLHENALPLGTAGEFGSGRLGAGAAADGWLAFDVPAGTTTLVLSNWQGESLAAVRIPA